MIGFWTCASCGAMFPARNSDAAGERCSKCVEAELWQQRALRAEADVAALREKAGKALEKWANTGRSTPFDTEMADLAGCAYSGHPGASLLAVASAAAALVEANGDAQYDALRAAVETWRKR